MKSTCIICCPDSKKLCKCCKLFQVRDEPYLCSYCNNDNKYTKTKEIQLKLFLEANKYTFQYNKYCKYLNSKYYIDFLIDCNDFFVIIECDENGHRSYDIECERQRESNIQTSLQKNCIFIRFNPDKKGIKIDIKEKILKSYIDYYTSKSYYNNEVVYLFY
jgi:hypothetical protein